MHLVANFMCCDLVHLARRLVIMHSADTMPAPVLGDLARAEFAHRVVVEATGALDELDIVEVKRFVVHFTKSLGWGVDSAAEIGPVVVYCLCDNFESKSETGSFVLVEQDLELLFHIGSLNDASILNSLRDVRALTVAYPPSVELDSAIMCMYVSMTISCCSAGTGWKQPLEVGCHLEVFLCSHDRGLAVFSFIHSRNTNNRSGVGCK